MKPYYDDGKGIVIYHGDCRDILPQLEPVDLILTDPPYGLSFMGKKWDYDVPDKEIWELVLNVMKPGATMFCFAGTRTQHRMAVNVEDAGFTLKDCLMWLYGTGFPKATDISKQLDKGHERKVIGKTSTSCPDFPNKCKGHPTANGSLGGGTMKHSIDTEPSTVEAKLWNGWKSHGLKPAYEPILLTMKPNDGNYAENALKHGVSGLNIDGGRIGERFPANILFDEDSAKMLDEQSCDKIHSAGRKRAEGSAVQKNANSIFLGDKGSPRNGMRYGDDGGASRFFYVAKASKGERGIGNVHPTVKPIKLIQYLLTLGQTPTGGITLDPFLGSGTTLLAAIRMNRQAIGIEQEEKYCEIAAKRLQQEVFDFK